MDDRITELAHELRTPLAGVLAAIELVSDAPVPLEDSEIDELLGVARSEANQLRAIIDGVVQRTRLDSGTLEVEREPIAVIDIVEDTLARFPGVSDRTAIVGDTELVVSTDRGLAEQILTNLIQNVARYAPSGPVSIGLERTGDVVGIRVSDSGPGLPGGDVPSSQGLGVGLSTSRRLAGMIGGSLEPVSPLNGKGASFELSLPASDEPIERRGDSEQQATPPPRARLLQEVADLLLGTSVDRILTGVGRLSREMLGAAYTRVLERRDDTLVGLATDDDVRALVIEEELGTLLSKDNGTVTMIEPDRPWVDGTGLGQVAVVTMRSTDGPEGLLVVGWPESRMPGFAEGVLPALAALALVGLDRRSVGEELEFERRVRAAVMDSLPIAISVFSGMPPRVIGWNRAEREMLGLDPDDVRPEQLTDSQRFFQVRFEDGTPLDGENAPIIETLRTGESRGPFHLRIVRKDGSEAVTRTYCAPVRDANGHVLGAVVTSEPVATEHVERRA